MIISIEGEDTEAKVIITLPDGTRYIMRTIKHDYEVVEQVKDINNIYRDVHITAYYTLLDAHEYVCQQVRVDTFSMNQLIMQAIDMKEANDARNS